MNKAFNITFVHKDIGRCITLDVESTRTASEIISKLIEIGFIPPANTPASIFEPYMLRSFLTGSSIDSSQTLHSAGICDGMLVVIEGNEEAILCTQFREEVSAMAQIVTRTENILNEYLCRENDSDLPE